MHKNLLGGKLYPSFTLYRGAEKVSAFFVSGISSLFDSVVGDGAKIIAPACFSGRWHQKKCPTDRETVH